ncbi:MAG: hypothetical protein IT426_01220 [Pirellulales bacterium]|nr:hypothetical protein [Pirellulales bacterium]
MHVRQLLVLSAVTALFSVTLARADEGRYVQIGGITYYDVYRTVPRTVLETANRQTTRTVYKEQVNTETRDVARTWWCPVTSYRTETELVGKWNFFIEPYYETRLVPETHWVQHSEVAKMPVTCRKLVPETQTVQVPVTTRKVVWETVLVSRMMVGGASPAGNGPVPRPTPQATPTPTPLQTYRPVQSGEPIGGIARLSQDPPRYGTNPSITPLAR